MPNRLSGGIVWRLAGTMACCATTAAWGVADIGGNIEGNTDWQTSAMWTDVTKTFRTWGDPVKPWEPNPGLQLTADGYPLQSAGAQSYMYDYPDGVYKLSYRGTGNVSFSWMGSIQNVQHNGDLTTADVVVSHQRSPMLLMSVTGIDPQNPVRDLHLMVPGATPGQVFTDQFLHRLAPLSTIRFMDLFHTNGNPVQTWSQRTTADTFIQTSPNGIAPEYAVAMANESGKDPWLNVPAQADDDYVRNLAKLVHQTLAPDRTVYVEYSNEVWNTAFAQYGQVLAMAKANPDITAIDDLGKVAQQDGVRTKEIGDIFRQEFGGDAGRVKIILGGQAAWTHHASTALSYMASHYGDVAGVIDGLAIAPYVGFSRTLDLPGLTVDGMLGAMNESLDTTVTTWIRNSSVLADQYGLPLMAYEGGQGVEPWNPNTRDYTNQDVKTLAEHDPRMGELYERLIRVWEENGGGLYNMYNWISADSNFGYWGLLEDVNEPGSPKWDAILRMTQLAGDADLSGALDAADLNILLANLGKSGMWWEQGDFNADGVVNSDDLTLFDRGLARAGLYRMGAMVVPEPGTAAGVLMGVALLGLWGRRRRRSGHLERVSTDTARERAG